MAPQIHVAVTRNVKPGCEEQFESSIKVFFTDALKDSPTLGALLLRPLPGSGSRTYGILRSFASEGDRRAFYESDRFEQWQDAVRPLVEDEYARTDLHGLEAFFADPSVIRRPPRWKMALVTWMGVWPTVYAVSVLLGKRLQVVPGWVATGVATFVVVLALTWAVMPLLTMLARPWLMRSRT